MSHIIAIYEIDREFAGPEEGGIWIDCGTLIKILAVVRTEARAVRVANRLNRWIARIQSSRTPVSSIAYRGGRLEARTYIDKAPEHYPEARPEYR